MVFHNFSPLISRYKRPFQLIQIKDGSRVNSTSRFENSEFELPTNCEGVFETISEKDFKRYPDFELKTSDLKVTCTPAMLNNVIPKLKDNILYSNVYFHIIQIIDHSYYGNYYILFLRKEDF